MQRPGLCPAHSGGHHATADPEDAESKRPSPTKQRASYWICRPTVAGWTSPEELISLINRLGRTVTYVNDKAIQPVLSSQ